MAAETAFERDYGAALDVDGIRTDYVKMETRYTKIISKHRQQLTRNDKHATRIIDKREKEDLEELKRVHGKHCASALMRSGCG